MDIYVLRRCAAWDEYNGAVVVANNADEAKQIANAVLGRGKEILWETVTLVDINTKGLVLDSFVAG